jgi:hypothetical protein
VSEPTALDRAVAQIGKPYFSATATDSLLGDLVDRIDTLTAVLSGCSPWPPTITGRSRRSTTDPTHSNAPGLTEALRKTCRAIDVHQRSDRSE